MKLTLLILICLFSACHRGWHEGQRVLLPDGRRGVIDYINSEKRAVIHLDGTCSFCDEIDLYDLKVLKRR